MGEGSGREERRVARLRTEVPTDQGRCRCEKAGKHDMSTNA